MAEAAINLGDNYISYVGHFRSKPQPYFMPVQGFNGQKY